MWTDGRYYLQAQKQLHEGWEMMKMEQNLPSYFEWIKDNLPKGSTIGVDPGQIPVSSFETRKKYFEDHGIILVGTDGNLVDEVWAEERPSRPKEKVWVLEEKYSGETTLQKYDRIIKKMDSKATMLLVTTLDDIAWTLNLRGSDISFNPMFFSYLLLHKQPEGGFKGDLFIDTEKVDDP
jgi:Xaa-Pro aminopeptidase